MFNPFKKETASKKDPGKEEIIINPIPEVPGKKPDTKDLHQSEEHQWVNASDLQAMDPDEMQPGEEYITGI
jgi:hypothetical protein